MTLCYSSESLAAEFSTDSESVSLTVVGNSVLIEGDATGPVVVSTGPTFRPSEPLLFRWAITELSHDAAFGLGDSGDPVRTGAINCMYLSNGDIVLNGVVVRQGPALLDGDELVLYFDPDEGVAAFYVNGVPV